MRITHLACLVAGLVCSGAVFAQPLASINYLNCGLSTQTCNVFNTSPLFNPGGFTHYPMVGGAYYNGTEVRLQTANPPTNEMATGYAIAYPFKANYPLVITIIAADSSVDPTSAPLLQFGGLAALPNPNVTDPTGCGPVGENGWLFLNSNIWNTATLNRAYKQYSWLLTPNSTGAYVYFLASGGSQIDGTTVYIKSLTIGPPTFTLSPGGGSQPCGRPGSPINFSVSNNNGLTGITSYTWNLGAPGTAGNGWLYDGSPAPQYITTTTNSVSLTTTGCETPGPVTLTVNTAVTSYQTNTANVSLYSMPLTVTGPSQFCNTSAQTYTVSTPPCNATVTWSSIPAGVLNLTPNGLSVTVSPVSGVIDAYAALIATPSGCGLPGQMEITVADGIPNISCSSIGNGTCSIVEPQCSGDFFVGTGYTIPNADGDGYNSWLWTLSGAKFANGATSLVTAHNVPTTPYNVIPNAGVNTAYLSIQPTNACGYVPSGIPFQYIILNTGEACGSGEANGARTGSGTGTKPILADSATFTGSTRFTVSPNPARSTLAINAAGPGMQGFIAIDVIDALGTRRQQKIFGEKIYSTTLDIGSLGAGIYIVRIYDGSAWEVHKVLVLR
jgi:hypothetical protein